MRYLVVSLLLAASAIPASAQHCYENMSFHPRSRVGEFVDQGNGRYYLEGPILEPELHVTFRDFQRSHARRNIIAMDVREHTSDRCFDELTGVTLTTVPLQPRNAPTPLATVTLGMHGSYKEYVKAMKKAGIKLGAAYSARDRTVEGVVVSPQPQQVTFVVVTPRDLGFWEDVLRRDFYAQAEAHGLRLCPPEAALALRLAVRDVPRNELIWVASENVRPKAYAWYDMPAAPRIFALTAAGDGTQYLVSDNAYEGDSLSYIGLDRRYAFAVVTP